MSPGGVGLIRTVCPTFWGYVRIVILWRIRSLSGLGSMV
jgi:hypothetical protein